MKRLMFRLIKACSSTPSGESASKWTKRLRCLQYRYAESKANLTAPPRAFGAMTVVALMVFSGGSMPNAHAQAPPQYELTWVENIWGADWSVSARDINDAGVVVGKVDGPTATAFRFFYDNQLESWVTQDLNGLGAVWIDLEDPTGPPPTAWTATRAEGVNAAGQIVGTASHANYEDRVFVLSFPPGSQPRYELLTRSGIGENRGGAINDAGVVVADGGNQGGIVYTPWSGYQPVELSINYAIVSDINNSGLIVTRGNQYVASVATPAVSYPDLTYDYDNVLSPPQFVENHNFYGVNDNGMICGRRYPVGRGRNKINGGPIRIDEIGNELLLAVENGNAWASDINDAGDVCYTMSGTPFVFTDANGLLGLDQLVVNPDDDWQNLGIYPRGINNGGQICGHAGNGDESFILTPIVPGPTVSVDDLTIDEGNSGTTTAGQFTITLSELTGGDVMVPYEIVGGTATAGDDYTTTASSGLLTFAFSAGETSKTVEFTIVGDDTIEPDETFLIQLGEAVGGAVVNKSEGTATIKNDEVSNLTLTVDDLSVTEGDRKDKTRGEYTITLSAASASDVQVWYQVSNGSAGNKDYRMVDMTSDVLTFSPGDTSKAIRFDILGDTRQESDETFSIELTDALGAAISKSIGTTTIIDND